MHVHFLFNLTHHTICATDVDYKITMSSTDTFVTKPVHFKNIQWFKITISTRLQFHPERILITKDEQVFGPLRLQRSGLYDYR